ncbi:hypothetical protein [Flammeovirga aprica]|uniref:Uncharacterized protein n=1 Tax=Flammeovirga aprica JL-4 TaxID=694437 RepID=A0A7X9XB72_9BACT|nr:hypothetical protein [Flammeovirga aprica]NME70437.1 hypothetical protein [Flammeovirga aprica JL-4]
MKSFHTQEKYRYQDKVFYIYEFTETLPFWFGDVIGCISKNHDLIEKYDKKVYDKNELQILLETFCDYSSSSTVMEENH